MQMSKVLIFPLIIVSVLVMFVTSTSAKPTTIMEDLQSSVSNILSGIVSEFKEKLESNIKDLISAIKAIGSEMTDAAKGVIKERLASLIKDLSAQTEHVTNDAEMADLLKEVDKVKSELITLIKSQNSANKEVALTMMNTLIDYVKSELHNYMPTGALEQYAKLFEHHAMSLLEESQKVIQEQLQPKQLLQESQPKILGIDKTVFIIVTVLVAIVLLIIIIKCICCICCSPCNLAETLCCCCC